MLIFLSILFLQDQWSLRYDHENLGGCSTDPYRTTFGPRMDRCSTLSLSSDIYKSRSTSPRTFTHHTTPLAFNRTSTADDQKFPINGVLEIYFPFFFFFFLPLFGPPQPAHNRYQYCLSWRRGRSCYKLNKGLVPCLTDWALSHSYSSW